MQGVLDRVKPQYLKKQYCIDDWNDAEDFMSKIAFKSGRLLKGGEPDIGSVAKQVLNDFQRGKLPYFSIPPGCEERAAKEYDQVNIYLFIYKLFIRPLLMYFALTMMKLLTKLPVKNRRMQVTMKWMKIKKLIKKLILYASG